MIGQSPTKQGEATSDVGAERRYGKVGVEEEVDRKGEGTRKVCGRWDKDERRMRGEV